MNKIVNKGLESILKQIRNTKGINYKDSSSYIKGMSYIVPKLIGFYEELLPEEKKELSKYINSPRIKKYLDGVSNKIRKKVNCGSKVKILDLPNIMTSIKKEINSDSEFHNNSYFLAIKNTLEIFSEVYLDKIVFAINTVPSYFGLHKKAKKIKNKIDINSKEWCEELTTHINELYGFEEEKIVKKKCADIPEEEEEEDIFAEVDKVAEEIRENIWKHSGFY